MIDLELNNDYRSDRYGFCRANISHASLHAMACSPLYSTMERTPSPCQDSVKHGNVNKVTG